MALRSDYLIEKRRTQESQLKNLYSFIQKDNNVSEKAKWENKSNSIVEKLETDRKFNEFHTQRKKFIDIRRKKLAELLIAEDEQYKREIIANQETPLQVREKMEVKLKALKEEKEKVRKEEVDRKLKTKFYSSADELRKNDSEAFAMECYLEQENQMLDKLKKREEEKLHESIYVKLNELDIKKKEQKEKMMAIDIEKKKKETYQYLEWLKIQNKNEEQRQKKLRDLEAQRIKDQWEKDNLREIEDREIQKITNGQVYKEIQEFNKQEEDVKGRKIFVEKKKDKDLVDSIVNKEKALDDIDRKEKERKKQEFSQNKKYLEYVMNQKKEAEAWMDHLAKEEADKKWRKEQDAWMKQENARIELLKKVYQERENAINRKRKVDKEERDSLLAERAEVDKAIIDYNNKLEEIKVVDSSKRKSHQDDLLYQIEEKNRLRQKEHQDKIYEERAAKLWEIEYQKKIDEQRALHLQRLSKIKNQGMSN